MAEKPKLNVNARPFNPNARAFVPGGAAAAAPAADAANSPAPSPPIAGPASAPILPAPARSATAPEESPKSNAAAPAVQDSWESAAPAAAASPTAAAGSGATPAPHVEHKAPLPSTIDVPVSAASKADEPEPVPVSNIDIPASSPSPDDNIEMTDELRQELAEIAREDAEVGKKPPKKKGTEEFKVHDSREHLNIVFIGHVDAGKSTVSGQILLLTGQVDERTIQKYEREAKDKGRDSWYLAYIMDTNEEERAKGKTVEVGRAHFETKNKRYTLLDAPGHKNYVPNMIGGVVQADVGILIISARKGEFETGFEKGGQTREHALLAKTMGVHKLVVAINKMDESTVAWSQQRYNSIVEGLTPFLKKMGYKPQDLSFVPISGYTGANIRDVVPESVCPWYNPRKSLLDILDELPPVPRDEKGPLRIPVIARYKDMGSVVALGKIECGTLTKGQKLIMVPNKKELEVVGIEVEDEEVNIAKPGENVNVKLKGVEEEEIQTGFVLGDVKVPPKTAWAVEAQLLLLDLLEHKPIMSAGYLGVLHVHSAAVECQVTKLVAEMDPKTGQKTKRPPMFARSSAVVVARIAFDQPIPVETFKDVPQLGRFTLRDEGRTIAIGKILRLSEKQQSQMTTEEDAKTA